MKNGMTTLFDVKLDWKTDWQHYLMAIKHEKRIDNTKAGTAHTACVWWQFRMKNGLKTLFDGNLGWKTDWQHYLMSI